jgi:hypothetical protein
MDEEYEIINVIARPECIDTQRSEIEWYEPGNDIRPDLAGTPLMIAKLVIDSNRTDGHHILRPKDWEVVIVVSEILKSALEAANVTGVKFKPVT